ncbi:hypothetical protein [Methylovulum miyakonense]|uniref:hypothetical protein n=1 Tax=Methylovulum miyakonense TaxID=645578 RepID=UPI000373360D|nr:hypothetical protein [Methylovulum miyakonense]
MGGLSNRAAWSLHEVRQRLEAGEELSTLEQTLDAGGWRLGATIHRLKKEFELPILSYRRQGFGKVAFYRLVKCMHQSAQADIFEKNGFPPENLGIRGQHGDQ